MLEFIKRYRNDPKRLVLTLKIDKTLCLNRLGDLNLAQRAKREMERKKNVESNDMQATTMNKNDGDMQGEGSKMKKAFKQEEKCVCLDDCNCIENGNECDCKDGVCTPCMAFDAKGGVNSEKTIRVLLCDALLGSMMIFGACMMKSAICKKKCTKWRQGKEFY